jgi:hypothetical protein
MFSFSANSVAHDYAFRAAADQGSWENCHNSRWAAYHTRSSISEFGNAANAPVDWLLLHGEESETGCYSG